MAGAGPAPSVAGTGTGGQGQACERVLGLSPLLRHTSAAQHKSCPTTSLAVVLRTEVGYRGNAVNFDSFCCHGFLIGTKWCALL